MRKSRFTEAQIIGMISPATFYKLKSEYGGTGGREAEGAGR